MTEAKLIPLLQLNINSELETALIQQSMEIIKRIFLIPIPSIEAAKVQGCSLRPMQRLCQIGLIHIYS
jgi:hypothetical protein